MSQWTPTAKQALERYLEKCRNRYATIGGDTDEVVADLRRHVEEEVASLKLSSVTEQDVNRILARLGHLPEAEPAVDKPAAPKPGSLLGFTGSGALMLFGVLLPLGTLIFEFFSNACADAFFDPIPTWFHILMVALVPLANGLAWAAARGSAPVSLRALWLANGLAVGISFFYAILFLPMSPFAAIGIIFYGFGFLPLSPLLSFFCALRLRKHLRKRLEENLRPQPRGWWPAMLTGAALLLVVALPAPLTRHWINVASSSNETEARGAVKMLRLFGSEEVMLRECYGRVQRDLDFTINRVDSAEAARQVFYRVTGTPFNSVPPPMGRFNKATRSVWDEFEWDAGLGGEMVAGQVKGLSMTASRLDATCKPEEGWGYIEWIMEFRNDHARTEREARAQIQLPPGAVVSRLTLWVNGEEREAAFAGRGEVRAAYQKVAVQQRRDPVLVTTSGPDRVLMQCFPVPRNGGTMKVRVGMTVPLTIANEERMAMRLPCFTERNFRLADGFEHSVWLDSTRRPLGGLGNLGNAAVQAGQTAVHGQVKESDLHSPEGVLWFDRSLAAAETFSVDARREDKQVIRQAIEAVAVKAPERVAIVLDGSVGMTESFPAIAKALGALPSALERKIFFAQEGVEVFDRFTARDWSFLGSKKGVGGQDNLPALLAAWDWASSKADGKVVWIHATQPIVLSSVEALKQRIERTGGGAVSIVDVPVEVGPNRITEGLSSSLSFVGLTRVGALEEDLTQLFKSWNKEAKNFRFVRSIVPGGTASADHNGSSHIVRLWALEEIQRKIGVHHTTGAVELAGLYQLVTSVSGAVVLETKQQFDEAGLTPVDAASVPTIPEPGTWALIIMALVLVGFVRKMKGMARASGMSSLRSRRRLRPGHGR